MSRTLSLFLLALLSVVNIWIDHAFVQDIRKVFEKRPPPFSHYTWVEDDVPERFPLYSPRPHVHMSVEESVRYAIHAPEAPLEWLYTATAHDMGNTHLGPPQRARIGVVALAHQQHCLRALRAALAADEVPKGHALHHAEHCLSFLRESTLCAADATLEPGDAFARNFTQERVGGERECMDAEAFYASMLRRWEEWVEVRDQTAKAV
uniref:Calcium dependent mitochondrial carrier protein n=1 Tax=Ganoderma boninense TaxID=34458 RepID=A0A5K1JYP5_9APHY|nr:Calcium dependent mitochondrial carrier protein [Ganoderma boninense]